MEPLTEEEIAALQEQLVADGHMTKELIDGKPHYRLTPKGFEEAAQTVAEIVLKLRLPGPSATKDE